MRRAKLSLQGGVQTGGGAWELDVVQRYFVKSFDQTMELRYLISSGRRTASQRAGCCVKRSLWHRGHDIGDVGNV
jgi:hypothetical protein